MNKSDGALSSQSMLLGVGLREKCISQQALSVNEVVRWRHSTEGGEHGNLGAGQQNRLLAKSHV